MWALQVREEKKNELVQFHFIQKIHVEWWVINWKIYKWKITKKDKNINNLELEKNKKKILKIKKYKIYTKYN